MCIGKVAWPSDRKVNTSHVIVKDDNLLVLEVQLDHVSIPCKTWI